MPSLGTPCTCVNYCDEVSGASSLQAKERPTCYFFFMFRFTLNLSAGFHFWQLVLLSAFSSVSLLLFYTNGHSVCGWSLVLDSSMSYEFQYCLFLSDTFEQYNVVLTFVFVDLSLHIIIHINATIPLIFVIFFCCYLLTLFFCSALPKRALGHTVLTIRPGCFTDTAK